MGPLLLGEGAGLKGFQEGGDLWLGFGEHG